MSSTHQDAERFRYLVLATQRQGSRLLNENLKTLGLTSSQAEVIRVLEERAPISLKDLGSLLICETGSPSRLIERMTADGLVRKYTHPDDSRYVLLELTTEGHRKAVEIRDFEQRMYAYVEEVLTREELESAGRAMEKFLQDKPVAEALSKRGILQVKPVPPVQS